MTDNNKQAPQNTPDEIDDLVTRIFNHGREVERHGSPYSHTPPKFIEEANALITAARIDELETIDNKIRRVWADLTFEKMGGDSLGDKNVPPEGLIDGLKQVAVLLEDRIAILTNDKIGGEHGGLERRSDGSE